VMNATALRDEAIFVFGSRGTNMWSQEAMVMNRLRRLLLHPVFSPPAVVIVEAGAAMMIGDMVVTPDLQLLLFAHASSDTFFMHAMQAGGLNNATAVLGRIACTCRSWAWLASSDELWRSVLHDQIRVPHCGFSDRAALSPLRTQMKALCVLKILKFCMWQCDDVSNKSRPSSVEVLLQQLALCEALLTAMIDSTFFFDVDFAAWVRKNLVRDTSEQECELPVSHDTLHFSRQLQDTAPVWAASDLLQSVLVDVQCMSKCLRSKLDAIKAVDAEAYMKRVFGKKSKWPSGVSILS